MKKTQCGATAAVLSLLMLTQSACSTFRGGERAEVIAAYTAEPIKLDGRLDESVWGKTPAYQLRHSRRQWETSHPGIRKFFRHGVAEPGRIRALWNDQYLYVGAEFTDSDVVAEYLKDQEHHYLMGDVVEVFLKPANQTWYWEMYATPTSNKTVFFYVGRGRSRLPSCFPKKIPLAGLKVAAAVDGTLNNPWDRDVKWTAEMAVPIAELNLKGEKLTPEAPWLIFFGRYNYSRYLPVMELTAFPGQERTNFNSIEDFGRLKLVK